ncbi:MAG: tyrosine-type recombinase/integrase [Candidatus Omnitrophica bacterium]|nr:tyrosine-type recombinase/integrase [Candidatus Omnitrophota bacterium]
MSVYKQIHCPKCGRTHDIRKEAEKERVCDCGYTINGKGGVYYIDYYYQGRRKRECIGPDKRLAETVLKKREVEIRENRYLNIRKERKIRFEDFADEFFLLHSEPNKKPSSIQSDKIIIKTLKSFFSGRYLYNIGPELVEEYKAQRSKDVKPATVNRELACLKCMFNRAIAWGKTEENPVRKVKLFKEQNARTRYLEKAEIRKLIESCSPHLRPIVIVAVNTGMRKGEILKLKWNDIDFKTNLIYLMETKNNEIRKAPMNNTVRKTLMKIPKHPDSPYIFCNAKGKPYANVRKSFDTALTKAKITDLKFHDLRHTFASHLVMLGIDLKTVQELLGHKSFSMTLRYSHLSPDHKDRAVDILDSNLSEEKDSQWTAESDNELIRKAASFVTADN